MEIVQIWQNMEKKRNTDYDFPPYYMWAENNYMRAENNKRKRIEKQVANLI